MNLKEKLYKRNRIYSGKAVGFSADKITLPNGKIAIREFLEHPGAIAVLPFLKNGKIILVKQYRYPIKKITYEIPAGKLDKGENPVKCVQRELEEETGFKAGKIKKMFSFWPTSAFSNEIIHIYSAKDLRLAKKNPDDDEFIEHIEIPFKKALQWVKSGKIRDSKTVIALLFWQ
ncbi:MAG: NUDIX hydrolase [Elusimicrobia bacterium]|nr:NUDIX hydrolase [Elusimicrobiota bacterium]